MEVKTKYASIYTKDYPIVISKIHPVEPRVYEVDEYFEALENYLDSTTGNYVHISFAEVQTKFIPTDARKRIANHASRLTEKYKSRDKGSIVVAYGIVAKAMLKAIGLLYISLSRSVIVNSLEEAMQLGKEMLAKK